MQWSPDPIRVLYVGVPAVGLIVGTAIVYWLCRRGWDRRDVKWFVATVATGEVLAGVQVVYLLVDDRPVTYALYLVSVVLTVATIAAFVVFTSVYTDRGFHRRLPIRAGLLAAVGGTAVLAASEWVVGHGLLAAEWTVRTDPVTYVVDDPGVGFVAVIVLLLTTVGYGLYALVVHLLTTQYRASAQVTLVVFAGLSVALLEVLGQVGVFPLDGYHHAMWGLVSFASLAAVALFRLQLFDVQPVARSEIVEHLHDPILILDRERRLVDYNERARRLWPAVDALVGRPVGAVSGPLAEAVAFPDDERTAGTNQQVTLSTPDGRTRHYSATVTTVRRRHSDEVGWYTVLLRDVTAIERSRRRLELQNEQLDRVAETVSHDLRNPIQVADGFTDLAAEDLTTLAEREEAAADAREKLERVDGAIDRMEEIVENVLTLARDGRPVEDTDPVALADVAQDAWRHVATESATLDLAVDPGWTVEADRSRLLSILENLFRNALDHGGADVTVTVMTTANGFVVADDGPGIPPAERADVFEYGYSTADDGTGLGLAIVRTMAESHDWTVAFEESDGGGARFVFDVDPSATRRAVDDADSPDDDRDDADAADRETPTGAGRESSAGAGRESSAGADRVADGRDG